MITVTDDFKSFTLRETNVQAVSSVYYATTFSSYCFDIVMYAGCVMVMKFKKKGQATSQRDALVASLG